MEKVKNLKDEIIDLQNVSPDEKQMWKGQYQSREEILMLIGEDLYQTISLLSRYGL